MYFRSRSNTFSYEEHFAEQIKFIREQLLIVCHQIYEHLQEIGINSELDNKTLNDLVRLYVLTPLEIDKFTCKCDKYTALEAPKSEANLVNSLITKLLKPSSDTPYNCNSEPFKDEKLRCALIQDIVSRIDNYQDKNVYFETNTDKIWHYFLTEHHKTINIRDHELSDAFCLSLENYLFKIETSHNILTKLQESLAIFNNPKTTQKYKICAKKAVLKLLSENRKEIIPKINSIRSKFRDSLFDSSFAAEISANLAVEFNFLNKQEISSVIFSKNSEEIAKIKDLIKRNELWNVYSSKISQIPDFFSCLELAYEIDKNSCYAITCDTGKVFIDLYAYLYTAIPYLHIAPSDDPQLPKMILAFRESLKKSWWGPTKLWKRCDDCDSRGHNKFLSDFETLLEDSELYISSGVYKFPWKESTPKFWELASEKYDNSTFKALKELFNNPIYSF